MRQAKTIGKALDAKVELRGGDGALHLDSRRTADLCELLGVSRLAIVLEDDIPDVIDILVSKADGKKCERCWHWETEVGANSEHPTLCPRCFEALKEFKS